jgi:hypothetical protein
VLARDLPALQYGCWKRYEVHWPWAFNRLGEFLPSTTIYLSAMAEAFYLLDLRHTRPAYSLLSQSYSRSSVVVTLIP